MGSRKLTDGEVALCKSVFKNEIDTSKVEIYNEKWAFFQPDNTVMAPRGNVHYPPDHWGYSEDISKATVGGRALLIHELTHVYQFQKGVNVIWKGMWNRDYDYLPMDAASKWSDYGIEEQGDIVQDYYKITQGKIEKVWPSLHVYMTVIPWLASPFNDASAGVRV